LHVLGLPPAFVLSQDQTLKLRFDSDIALEGISSKGSLRFDEFPTNMKRRNPFGITRNTPIGFLKTQDRQSLDARPPKRTSTQGLRRLRFPFFILQCQRAGGHEANPIPEPPMEANPPLGVNDSRSSSRRLEPAPPLSEGSRGHVQPRRKRGNPREMLM
jgi:hypothetical protein